MTRRIRISDGAQTEAVLAANGKWIEALQAGDRDRLSKEVADLIYHGQMMADQGAAFSSKRTVTLGEETVELNAKFGQPSLWRRIVGTLGE